jgi:ribosome recycling factor
MTLDEILMDAEERMIKSEQAIVNEFANVRTGKASAGLVENIQAEVYGSMMRIRELANISSPEPRMLVVTPWDVAALQPIEKAIQKANIGLSPVVQGKLLRLSFPELSTERRQEFVKLIKKMAEDARVSVRHIRRDAMDLFKKHAHDSGITEDGKKQAEKDLQKLTDDYTGKIDAHVAHKEKEIMTV